MKGTNAYYIQYYLPTGADRECNCQLAKESVARNGGKLEVLDSKVGKYFSVPLLHDGVQFRFADSLLVTIAPNGNVLSIFKNVSRAHLLMGLGLDGAITGIFGSLSYRLNQIISWILN
jgi:hypothetical protein